MTTLCPTLTIIVPCFNEQEVLPETSTRLERLLTKLINAGLIAADSSVCFVDDGSTDGTWALIQKLHDSSGRFGGIKLSRNRGHQNALITGLLAAPGDLLITLDADLQDDPNAIYEMLHAATVGGADIVFGVRRSRGRDAALKRLSARLYYRLLQLMKVEVVFDHADYRLMSRRAVEALRQYEETNLFLRALIPELGFKTSVVAYDRDERFAGSSKYSLSMMIRLAIEGVTSFSIQPLRIATVVGLCISIFSIFLTIWALYLRLVLREAIPGWASIVIPIYFIGGVQLLCLGIMGEYIGKIYLETKRRPRAHLAECLEPWAGEPRRENRSGPSQAGADEPHWRRGDARVLT
jgi:polyisoprenyl-phosphate glycosyltransferase